MRGRRSPLAAITVTLSSRSRIGASDDAISAIPRLSVNSEAVGEAMATPFSKPEAREAKAVPGRPLRSNTLDSNVLSGRISRPASQGTYQAANFLQCRCDLHVFIGLANEPAASGEIGVVRNIASRRHNELNRRPATQYGLRQFQTIHRPRQAGIYEDGANIIMAFQDFDRFAGVGSFQDFKTQVLRNLDDIHPDNNLVLNNQDDGLISHLDATEQKQHEKDKDNRPKTTADIHCVSLQVRFHEKDHYAHGNVVIQSSVDWQFPRPPCILQSGPESCVLRSDQLRYQSPCC